MEKEREKKKKRLRDREREYQALRENLKNNEGNMEKMWRKKTEGSYERAARQ